MPVTKKKETYSEAMARLEKIVSQIDNNELEIDVLAEKIKEANGIIAFCSDKLTRNTTVCNQRENVSRETFHTNFPIEKHM